MMGARDGTQVQQLGKRTKRRRSKTRSSKDRDRSAPFVAMRAERKLGGFRPRINSSSKFLLAAWCLLLPEITAFQLFSLYRPLERPDGSQSGFRYRAMPMTLRPRSTLACLPSRRLARLQRTSIADSASVGAFENRPSNATVPVEVVVRKTDTELNPDSPIEVKSPLKVLEPDAQGKIKLDALRLPDDQEESLRSIPRRIGKMVPKGDALDKQILLLTLPAVVNGLLLPIVGLIDAFYVGKLGDPLAFAAQGAANQVFSCTLGALSFLPTVITPLVAAAHARGKTEQVQRHVGEGMFLSVIVGMIGMAILLPWPSLALGLVLPAASMAYPVAVQYFNFRVLGFIPSLISSVGFSSLRGTMDTVRPMQVSLMVNAVRVVLEPALMFGLMMGVAGAGLSTMLCEVLSACIFLRLLLTAKLVRWSSMFKVPSLSSLAFLGTSGLILQMRALAMNAVFMRGAAAAQTIDLAGTSAAAHVLTTQIFSLGATILFALSTVATVLSSTGIAKFQERTRGEVEGEVGEAFEEARQTADRLLLWGAGIGAVLACLLACSMPLLHLLSPMPAVVEAARTPVLIGAGMMTACGVCFVGEGIMQGQKAFKELTVITLVASAGMLATLELFGGSLAGIWASFVVFNSVRSVLCVAHHLWLGPLSPRGRRKQLAAAAAPASPS